MSPGAAATGERRRGRPPRHDREQLLAVAADVLLDLGYQGLTYGSLSQRAGLPTASVQHHFPTVTQLRHDALERTTRAELAALVARLEGQPDPWAQVLVVIRDSIHDDPRRRRTGWTLWLEYYRAATYDDGVATMVDATRASWRATLAGVVQRGLDDGTFHTPATAMECAETLFALIDGFGLRLTTPHSPEESARIVTAIETVAERLLHRGATPVS